MVKYNTNGIAQWAQSGSGSGSGSVSAGFSSIAIDSSNNVYAVGHQYANYTYGNGVTGRGRNSSSIDEAVLVKYNSDGIAQWAQISSFTGHPSYSATSRYLSVAVDSFDNIYTAGHLNVPTVTNYVINYGNGITLQYFGDGTTRSFEDVLLVKYNKNGTAQWARTASSTLTGQYRSRFNTVAVDSFGNVYAAGYQNGIDIYTYGREVTAQGTNPYVNFNSQGNNALLVKYRQE